MTTVSLRTDSSFRLGVSSRPKYSKTPITDLGEPKEGYQGVPVGPRMSIE